MVKALSLAEFESCIEGLVELLVDAVESGASVGFLPPLSREEAEAYWRTVGEAMQEGHRELIAVVEEGRVEGAAQLLCETRANGRHRAEAGKLFVHRRARRRGLARLLMSKVEEVAAGRGISLLVMDTRKGGEAEQMCESLGYVRWGEVPEYARSANGELHTTVFYYRRLP